jgi:metal-responsive CopG/Arc/MetJ family transcriptional regulator
MKNLSLKIEEDIFSEIEKILTKTKKSRNRYINEAVDFYNKLHNRKDLEEKLLKESLLVASDSVKILAEMDKAL